ncbi:alpha/beta fold hydrolase [Nocardioides soli]|uniref:2-hydroxy-6-oxonona-2,4-dienedioate hydrolase n=1 Tax=Nocardioides soli TaxID=1036020 RepID=A0A7W4Z3M6_9ACTN|nr:alpha/beta hydrolase [Nocardioides soli]MBB3044011.1 2-hydroxy-6-oxonona-2,4-dienedioate hydrolase [Nocardioides soli]
MSADLNDNQSMSSPGSPLPLSQSLWQSVASVSHQLRYIETSTGARTRIIEAGAGPSLLLLHGTGGHLEVFLRNVGSFADDFHVVAMDLLGHGLTDFPDDEQPFDWRTVGEHVLATMDALGIDSAAIVGEALGAQVAQWLAVNHPARVDSLVLCCACILPEEDADDPSLMHSQAAFQELTARVLKDPGSVELMRERMSWLHLGREQVDEEMLELRMRFWTRKGFTDAHKRLLGSLRTARHDSRTSVSQTELQQIRIRTLIVWTEQNPLFSLDSALRLAEYLPNAQCEVFLESAMWPQFDEAAKFNALVKSWLRA